MARRKRSRIPVFAFLALIAVVIGALTALDYYGIEPGRRLGLEKPSDLKADLYEPGDPVFIRVFKQEAELEVWFQPDAGAAYELAKVYPICSWSGALGPKLKEGDRQSPEGFYTVDLNALNPNSAFHLSFNVGFPNAYDRSHGRTGSFLMIHGGCSSIGCYAMTDAGIEEIYGAVEASLRAENGDVPVHIFPFRMSEERLAAYADHRWNGFWQNLKQGYDLFERTKRPPAARVADRAYVFETASAGVGEGKLHGGLR